MSTCMYTGVTNFQKTVRFFGPPCRTSMCCGYRFCPSVFFYLLSVVPAIWFLELNQMERRIEEAKIRRNKTLTLLIKRNATDDDIDEFVNTMPVLKVCQSFAAG